ncbi:MAG: hypothetical protein ACJAUP_003786 [Cellvibrionaceae bacterium]|jgi:hypothetical protein
MVLRPLKSFCAFFSLSHQVIAFYRFLAVGAVFVYHKNECLINSRAIITLTIAVNSTAIVRVIEAVLV